MGKSLNKPMNRITQRSIGFNFWQILFFMENPRFTPDAYCRDAINNQILILIETGQVDKKWLDYIKEVK
jgi:hypothetical protein